MFIRIVVHQNASNITKPNKMRKATFNYKVKLNVTCGIIYTYYLFVIVIVYFEKGYNFAARFYPSSVCYLINNLFGVYLFLIIVTKYTRTHLKSTFPQVIHLLIYPKQPKSTSYAHISQKNC